MTILPTRAGAGLSLTVRCRVTTPQITPIGLSDQGLGFADDIDDNYGPTPLGRTHAYWKPLRIRWFVQTPDWTTL